LRRRWETVQSEAEALAKRRDEAKTPRTRNNRQQEMMSLLMGFAGELAQVQVLDAACGSANFLYIALKLLLDLEKQVISLAGSLGGNLFFPSVSPEQLHGIEINAYAHELAQATIWIGYIQWMNENGFGVPDEPILKPLDNILQMDAILAYDEAGKPVEPAWPKADVIIGNPPFLGDRKMRRELGDTYVDDLRRLYSGKVPSSSDLVCYWFERARWHIDLGVVKRAGLLATNSIRGGANRRVLDRIKKSGNIFMAWGDRPWILEGAAVRVSMVGYDDGSEEERILDGEYVKSINPDLTTGFDVSSAKRLPENQDLSFIGTQKSGPFDLTQTQADEMLNQVGNPSNRPNSDVIKPWINAMDVTRRPRHMWVVDFGPGRTLEESAQYEIPFEYVKQNVKPKRDRVRRKSHREKWWLFGDTRPGMRRAIAGLSRYIVTPMVSKHRLFGWVQPNVVAENLLVVIARDDDYLFGILHSRLHELWGLRQGTSLEDRPRYTPTSTFATFPFPWPPGKEPTDDPCVQTVAQAAKELVEKRDRWLNPEGATEKELKKRTLTNLYNQRPTWLDLAHKKLDHAVLDAYGWPHDITDEQILERLLALNLERAEKEI
jgi:type II restriction/modification system DNA methylase subunit YeeA